MKNYLLPFKYFLVFIVGYTFSYSVLQIFNTRTLNLDLSYAGFVLVFLYVIGGLFGINVYHKKDIHYKIWKLTRANIIFNVIIAAIYSLLITFFDENPSVRYVLSNLISAVIFGYPFSALSYYFYKHYNELTNKVKWIFLLIVMNPFFALFLGTLNAYLLPSVFLTTLF